MVKSNLIFNFIVILICCTRSSATNRLITAKDHASVQINVGDVNSEGRYVNTFSTYAFCGFVRKEAESDDSLNRLAQEDGCKYNFVIVFFFIDYVCRLKECIFLPTINNNIFPFFKKKKRIKSTICLLNKHEPFNLADYRLFFPFFPFDTCFEVVVFVSERVFLGVESNVVALAIIMSSTSYVSH